jgi:hypothetical protein
MIYCDHWQRPRSALVQQATTLLVSNVVSIATHPITQAPFQIRGTALPRSSHLQEAWVGGVAFRVLDF